MHTRTRWLKFLKRFSTTSVIRGRLNIFTDLVLVPSHLLTPGSTVRTVGSQGITSLQHMKESRVMASVAGRGGGGGDLSFTFRGLGPCLGFTGSKVQGD